MEEEREKSSSENLNGAVKRPDLDLETKEERSENDKKDADGDGDSREETAGKTVSAEDENRSFNESNSTENRRGDVKTEPEPEREPVELKPDSDSKPVLEEDSCNDSSDRHEIGKAGSRNRGNKDGVESDELRDSVDDSKEGTKDSSDVQSSASLTRRWRRKGDVHGSNVGGGSGGSGGADGATVVSPANIPIKRERDGSIKSEPLLVFLENIRSHKHGPLFERRLESQVMFPYFWFQFGLLIMISYQPFISLVSWDHLRA